VDAHEQLLQEFKQLLLESASRSAWCLDLGTGEGRVAFEIAPFVRWILGLDIKSPRIEAARRKAQNEGITNVQFIVGDIENILLQDLAPIGSFQLITTNLCLTNEIIMRAASALDSDGMFVGTCFETHHWHETGIPMDHAFSEEDLMHAIHDSGLELLDMDVIGHIVRFQDFKQVAGSFLPERLLDRWKDDGRLANLERAFEDGTTTLTESKIVFRAHKPGDKR
jgi:SAM-dependent methyltransferase